MLFERYGISSEQAADVNLVNSVNSPEETELGE
jgi:hypothetical protein